MAVENGINGIISTIETSTSKTHEEERRGSAVNGQSQKIENSQGDEKSNLVPFHKLFSFADSTDILLMIIGTLGAVGNGLSLPLMTVFLGDMIDAFGKIQNNKDVVHVVSKRWHAGWSQERDKLHG